MLIIGRLLEGRVLREEVVHRLKDGRGNLEEERVGCKEGGELGKLDVEGNKFVHGRLDRPGSVQDTNCVEVLQGTTNTINVLFERVFRWHSVVGNWLKRSRLHKIEWNDEWRSRIVAFK